VREHSVVTWRGRSGLSASVSCPVCGCGVDVLLKDPSADALSDAWDHFLRGFPWDCDAALVEGVMSK
jgi:hypothetical protein